MVTARSPKQVLSEVFGYSDFRGNQAEIIEHLISGKDAFVLMPTGGGKSLCYQIPSLVRDGVGIVISPLISLMKDQVDALCATGVNAAYLNSSLSPDRARAVIKELGQGEIDLLYVSPERILMPETLEMLKRIKLSIIAIDEAHCVSQWGHDFRPEYVQLGRLRQHFSDVPFVGLTATADHQTRKDVLEKLELSDSRVFISSFDRPNIHYRVEPKSSSFNQLEAFLDDLGKESVIIYCLSRKRVEGVAEKLNERGYKVGAYHAGFTSEHRSKIQEQFLRDDIQIVVATVAFGMGIDKPNVRGVVHMDMPKNVEGYYQETGRAGRDGLPSKALMLYGLGDAITIRKIIADIQNPQQLQVETHKLDAMVGYAESITCRRQVLLNYFGEDLGGPCGNCDVCQNPRSLYDGTEDAYHGLMCVYELKQKFGILQVIDVLRGAKTSAIRHERHDLIPSYGKGSGQSQDYWLNVFRQLIHLGYLRQDIADHSALKLTPMSRGIVRKEATLELVVAPIRETAAERKERRSRSKPGTGNYDEDVFQVLRILRKQLADAQEVPPYVIFSDATLQDMARKMPTTKTEMLTVSGVGNYKVDQYGEAFLEAIRSL